MTELNSKFITWFYTIFIIVVFGNIIKTCYKTNKYNYTPPVKESVNIDSVIDENKIIRIKLDTLDSIKNAKVIEVIALDNDSTIKLFYKLVQE